MFNAITPEKKSEFLVAGLNMVCITVLTALQPTLHLSAEVLTIGCGFLSGTAGGYMLQRFGVKKAARADLPSKPLDPTRLPAQE